MGTSSHLRRLAALLALTQLCAPVLAALAQPATPVRPASPSPSGMAAVPICRPAPNADYGFSPANPIQVGGGPMYGSVRQQRFLNALTGPAGQRVRVEPGISTTTAPDGTLVDSYQVTYDGLERPVSIVLDWYHYTEHFAPRGFLCGRDPQLDSPPPDPFLADEQIQALAAEIAAAPGFRAGPADLGGEPAEGLIVDRFRVQSRRVRASAAPPTTDPPGTIVVAYPQTCGGAVTTATAISLQGPQGQAMLAPALLSDTKAIQALMPGVDIPAGSVAATFAMDALRNGLRVRLTFPAPCAGPTAERLPGLDYRAAELMSSPMPERPAGDQSDVAWVAVQAIVDHQGRFQQPHALGGPPLLVKAALAAIAQWQAQPMRVNGAPVVSAVVLRVTFVAPAK